MSSWPRIVLDPQDDEAYDLVIAVAAGAVDDIGELAAVLASLPAKRATESRPAPVARLTGCRPVGGPPAFARVLGHSPDALRTSAAGGQSRCAECL